ncbi:PREDICTED: PLASMODESMATA CALLOSE-BINDING PROTEIN 3-like isoform X2 [Lupinus angustifolius]|uniref:PLASMODESMATA CALLOSE-BINDING PROTEIN 3-like isoform X2 n=1 Tax=Lupinus angustifolius TaxID=3871 RepID=UPI00092EED30|nr:PREDICTED: PLASMODESMATA CALLOSE-BINDING PROTEIN 3-like isoform X2 [Lupinus angustifolius]
MAAFPLSLLLLALMTPSTTSSMSWCVCKDGSDATLQKTLDYACGAGGDCNPLHQNGPCFQPNTLKAHCSYAVNSYYQKKGQAPMSCDFAGTATVTATNPSSSGCAYPSSASTTGTSTTPVSTTPTMGSNSSTTSTTPHGTTPGVLGGIGTGMGPSGSGNDESYGGLRLVHTSLLSPFSIVLFSGFIMVWWG